MMKVRSHEYNLAIEAEIPTLLDIYFYIYIYILISLPFDFLLSLYSVVFRFPRRRFIQGKSLRRDGYSGT